ncbi:MAG TPA: hypothetical protein DCL15_21550 [Chloroflexi bacterium]|nr:hypothetical protein [Chloroflexota bacterium]HHW86997.1 PQQ-binding-like beta-propeller repeat protein [Chloroflexota bacterium]
MSYNNSPYPPNRQRASQVLTISILVAFFVLIGLSWLWFATQSGLLLAPTPTPTATPLAATRTPTPDVRATNVAEDMLTQIAFAATSLAQLTGQMTPIAGADASPLPPGATQQVVQLPLVSAAGPSTPAPGQPDSPLAPDSPLLPDAAQTATAVFLPNINQPNPEPPTATPTLLAPLPEPPTNTPIVVVPPTDTPTPFTPLFTPTPTMMFIQVAELSAVARGNANTTVYVGPSTFFTPTTNALPPSAQIRLRGRTPNGDWLFACCLNDNQVFWVRPAYVTITGNPTPVGFPSDANIGSPQWDPNNPKWLPIVQIDPVLTPRPQASAIPPGDFPLPRYDRANTGRVPMLPQSQLQNGWGGGALASQPFRSPVSVSGANVLAISQDNQLYSMNRDSSSQRWRYELGGSGDLMPTINNGLIYAPFGGNRLRVVQDAGNSANPVADIQLPANATSSATFFNDVVFIGVGEGDGARLMAMKRDNYADQRFFEEPQARILQPAIGQETVYVAGGRLWAVDANFWQGIEVIWQSTVVNDATTPPVYAYPGVLRTAELYVADASTNVYALDANTGAEVWRHTVGAQVSALAINDANLFIAGSGLLRAVSRQSGQPVWTAQTGGVLSGGPFATGDRVLVVTQSGAVIVYDAATGNVVAVSSLPGVLNAAPALSLEWLFAPSANAILGYRGAP